MNSQTLSRFCSAPPRTPCFLRARYEGLGSFKTQFRHTKCWTGVPGPHSRGSLDTRVESRQKQGCGQTPRGSSPLPAVPGRLGPQAPKPLSKDCLPGGGGSNKGCCGRGTPNGLKCQAEGRDLVLGRWVVSHRGRAVSRGGAGAALSVENPLRPPGVRWREQTGIWAARRSRMPELWPGQGENRAYRGRRRRNYC